MNQETGKFIIIIGLITVVAGVLIYFFSDKINFLGKLPGDFRYEKDNFKFYFPLATSILLSVVISAIIYLSRKFF